MSEDNTAKEPNCFEKLKDDHILEKHRLESYKYWPFSESSTCSKSKMAQAGWYWTGTEKEPDTATCFLCSKTLDGWEETDDPWKEHAKHAPQCLFAKLARPEDQLTVAEFLEVFSCLIKNKVGKKSEQSKVKIQTEAAKEFKKFNH